MDRIIILTIFSIIVCMMLCIQNNLSLLSEKLRVGKVFDMRIHLIKQGFAKQDLTRTVLSYFPKSQHLTCQHTRAGTPDEPHIKRLIQGMHQAFGIGAFLRWQDSYAF